MIRMLKSLNKFWFPEAPAERLATIRILVGIFAFFLLAGNLSQWTKIGHTSPVLFKPVGVVSILSQPLPPVLDQILILVTLAGSVLFLVGWRYRFIGPAFAILLLWTISYRLSWSMIYHSMHLPVLHVLILGLSPAADAFSLDASRRGAALGGKEPTSSRRYGFPIQLICAVTVLAYLVTGVAKLAGPLGASWMSGNALRSQVAADAIRKEVLGSSGSSLFYRLYHQLWIFKIIGVMTFFVELGAPLALLNKRLGQLWSVAAFFMHWGILFIMSITFAYHISGVLYAPFFDVEHIPAWLRRQFAPRVLQPLPLEANASSHGT